MNLDNHISDLLYRHDCVIVTDFGGFVANYRPAFLHPAHHTISPPSKKVAFNANLTNNDGLLANYVATKLNISYNEACNTIKKFKDDCLELMNNGERLQLNKIGVLYLDVERNIQFIPDANANYSLHSFGLTTVHTPVIKRENAGDTIIKSFDRSEKKNWWRLLEVVPAAAALALLLLNPHSIDHLVNSSLNSFNPIDSFHQSAESSAIDTENKYNFTNEIFPVNNNTQDEKSLAAADTLNSNQISTGAQPTESAIVVTNNSTTSVETKPEPVATSINPNAIVSENKSATFYIIAGCFKIEENAINFKNDLVAKGYTAEIIGKHNGLSVVSCSSLTSNTEAEKELQHIHAVLEKGAWIMKK